MVELGSGPRHPEVQELHGIQLELPFPTPTPGSGPDGALETAARALFPNAQIEIGYEPAPRYLVSMTRHPCQATTIRARECFREAPAPIAEAIINLYLGRPRPKHRRHLSAAVHAWYQNEAAPPPSADVSALQWGENHLLKPLFTRVNERWFDGRLTLDHSYAPRLSRRIMARHERRSPRSLVLVNPILDHPVIETWYLEYLLFHEALHEIIRPVFRAGRLDTHPPEFHRREREHPDLVRARDYELWITGVGFEELREAHQARLRRRRGSRRRREVVATPPPSAR